MARGMRGIQIVLVQIIIKIRYVATNNIKIENPDRKFKNQDSKINISLLGRNNYFIHVVEQQAH